MVRRTSGYARLPRRSASIKVIAVTRSNLMHPPSNPQSWDITWCMLMLIYALLIAVEDLLWMHDPIESEK